MKTINKFLIALALLTPCATAQQQQVQLSATTGLGATLNYSVAGAPGAVTAYYVLMANFTGGSIPSNVVTVTNVPGTLNSTNFVSFAWTPVSGVVTYDLLKLTSTTLPSGSNSVALSTGISATTTAASDQGGSLSSYTIAAPPVNGVITLTLNSRDHPVPMFEVDGFPGQLGLATNGKALSIENVHRVKTDATATGVTLAAASVVNGIYLHAPTGAVNDTTDTAAALVAALPNCEIGTANGVSTGFLFTLINNSAGAHTITVLAGSGVTLKSSVSPLTVTQNTVQNFVGVVTNCATPAVALYSIGNAVVY